MRTAILWLVASLAAPAVSGCAMIRPRAAFGDVERLVAARTSPAIHWNQGSEADREVERRTKELLATELTADAAVQIALFNSPVLQATYERLGIAQADLVQAGLVPNPVVHAGLRLGVGGPGPGAELSLLQDFIGAIQIPLRKRVAGAAFEAAKLEVAQAIVDLAADVRVAFYTLQGAAQMFELGRTVARAAGYSAELARRQREAGNVTDLDLANEDALFEQARLDLARAEAELVEFREELNALLGLWGKDTEWKIAPRLAEPPADELPRQGLEALAVSQRLDLAAARQDSERLAQSLRLTRFLRFTPRGDVGVDSEREPEGEWAVGPAIEVPIPLFDQGQAAAASALAQLRQSLHRYRGLAVQIRARVRRARTRAEIARARADHYRQVVVPLRRRIVEETQLQYNAMQVGAFQLLQAKRDQIEAGRSYIEALTEYWVARAELERAVGGDLSLPAGTPPPAHPETPAPQRPDGPPHHHHGG